MATHNPKTKTDETMTTPTDTEIDDALEAATDVFSLDVPADSMLAPHGAFEVGTPEESIAAIGAPWVQIIRTVIDAPSADDVDGVAPGHLDREPAQSVVFEAAYATDDDTPAIVLTGQFRNQWGDTKVIIETPVPWETPDEMTSSNEVIKSLEWDDHHWEFDQHEEQWTIDDSGVDPLRDAATAEGYDVIDLRPGYRDTDTEDGLDRLTEIVEEGDRVTVRYNKKNGNGIGTKSGNVTTASDGGVDKHDRTVTQGVVFQRGDEKHNRIKRDDKGTPGVFSGGYHPFMGKVVSVEVVPEDE